MWYRRCKIWNNISLILLQTSGCLSFSKIRSHTEVFKSHYWKKSNNKSMDSQELPLDVNQSYRRQIFPLMEKIGNSDHHWSFCQLDSGVLSSDISDINEEPPISDQVLGRWRLEMTNIKERKMSAVLIIHELYPFWLKNLKHSFRKENWIIRWNYGTSSRKT